MLHVVSQLVWRSSVFGETFIEANAIFNFYFFSLRENIIILNNSAKICTLCVKHSKILGNILLRMYGCIPTFSHTLFCIDQSGRNTPIWYAPLLSFTSPIGECFRLCLLNCPSHRLLLVLEHVFRILATTQSYILKFYTEPWITDISLYVLKADSRNRCQFAENYFSSLHLAKASI